MVGEISCRVRVMRPRDRSTGRDLDAALRAFDSKIPLKGIRAMPRRVAFVEQMLESIRRVRYVRKIRRMSMSQRRADPNDELFDPLKAAVFNVAHGDLDEAFWLVFLFVHFGRHARSGWEYARDVYGQCGGSQRWDWPHIRTDVAGFRTWLQANLTRIQRGTGHGFGNHRRYVSLDGFKPAGTGAAVATYVDWVGPAGSHSILFRDVCHRHPGDPRSAFHELYRSMSTVASFGRLACFDYLTMV